MRSGRAILLSDYVGGEGAASGGAGHAARDSYAALRAAGADIRIVAGFGGVPDIAAGRFATLGGHDLRGGGRGDALRALYNPAAGRALAAELRTADPDATLVILHQWTRFLSPAALRVTARFPTMVYMHDYFWACPNGVYYDFGTDRPCHRRPMGPACLTAGCDRQGRATKLGRVARHALRQAVAPPDPARRLFLHLSEHAHRTAAPLLAGERHAILYNPLAMARTPPPPAPRPRYDVGYFGRLETDKGVALLADALARTGRTGLFVGQGALEPMLAERAGITHRPWQPRAAMADAMRSCAVVVLPSLWHETWGLIVPEAMAAGVRVLVSRRAGSAELVRRFGGGETFDPGLPGDLDAALRRMLASVAPPAAARDALRGFLSPERHAARIIALAGTAFGLALGGDRPVSPPAGRKARAPAPVPPPAM